MLRVGVTGMVTDSQDEEHLRLLRIFHYVYAGVTAVFALFPIVHVAMGIAIVTGAMPASSGPGGPPPEFLGWLFVGLGGIIILMGATIALASFFAGRMIGERRGRLFCMVLAGFNCLNMPFGTALGVFTLVVLSRPSVKQAFDASAHHR
jgi:hypothetical protein